VATLVEVTIARWGKMRPTPVALLALAAAGVVLAWMRRCLALVNAVRTSVDPTLWIGDRGGSNYRPGSVRSWKDR